MSRSPDVRRYGAGGERRLTPAYRPRQARKTAPCQVGCPNCADIREWIGTIAQRGKLGLSREEAFTRAWRTIVAVNPFPSVLGRVCPHPCEAHCNRGDYDEPVAINALERFLGDWAISAGLSFDRFDAEPREEWIGVVGGGPSGLSFAYQMAARGYRVTVYEAAERAGGMLRYGIPDYRLPPSVLDAEIQRILDLGVELEPGCRVGRDVSLEELRKRHDALYLGIGAQMGRGLGVSGEDGPSVWTGTDYLRLVNCGQPVELGARVAVVGGGNTAVDAARTARRAGAEVTILYRRGREEMPAIEHEVEDALEEGVELVLLASPERIERAPDGRIAALVARRMRLGAPDDSGRRRPVPIDGSEFRLEVDSVIAAVSQSPDFAGFEFLDAGSGWLARDGDGGGDGLLAGGDALGLGIAGNAIVQGRRAAEILHARLRGLEPPGPEPDARAAIGPDRVKLDSKERVAAARPPRLAVAHRLTADRAEVTATILEEMFHAEAARCLSCGSCFGCERCAMFCTAGCFSRLEEIAPGSYFTLMLENCQECGKCVEICPCGFLEVT
ncbi:MAG: FAD-dependent oxidoreductase [Gemmatimonadota bacterium]|nr:FAD-dependent oxidoreductase [Gemmatimonadota bacterium]